MAILLKRTSFQVSSIQIMEVRVQNKGKNVCKSRYVGDISLGSPTGSITLVSYLREIPTAYVLHHPFLFGEIPT